MRPEDGARARPRATQRHDHQLRVAAVQNDVLGRAASSRRPARARVDVLDALDLRVARYRRARDHDGVEVLARLRAAPRPPVGPGPERLGELLGELRAGRDFQDVEGSPSPRVVAAARRRRFRRRDDAVGAGPVLGLEAALAHGHGLGQRQRPVEEEAHGPPRAARGVRGALARRREDALDAPDHALDRVARALAAPRGRLGHAGCGDDDVVRREDRAASVAYAVREGLVKPGMELRESHGSARRRGTHGASCAPR
mmetsp:Transcript_7697/g.24210  ORF Transcript_7697/g.24210 Transcript_7697/m.24210 type:complete len:256 (+) Transcript_7697:526-1293(+)